MRTVVQAAPGQGAARRTCAAVVGLVVLLFCTGAAYAEPGSNEVNLIADRAAPAQQPPDPNLINPWSVSYSPASPFRSDNNSNRNESSLAVDSSRGGNGVDCKRPAIANASFDGMAALRRGGSGSRA